MAKVLFLHSSSDLYGADRSLIRTIDAVLNSGHSVIVCLPYEGPLINELQGRGCEVRILELGILRRKYFNPVGIFVFLLSLLKGLVHVGRIVRQEQIELIHSNTSAVLVGGFVSRILRVPHIWHVREILTRPIFLRVVIHFCLSKMSNQIVVVSRSTYDHLLVDQPNVSSKTTVIHNGLEIDLYRTNDGKAIRKELGLKENDILVGMIARVSHWKGQDLFIEIAQKTINEFDNVFFLALGSPFQNMDHLMTNFKESAEVLPSNRFFIHEFSDNVKDYLASFDVFLLPSTQPDPFPTTVLEAMAVKKAIIVNGHGGSIEMIEDRKSGYIVSPPNDSNGFLRILRKLILNPSLRDNLGYNAYHRVNECYSAEIYKKNIQDLLKKHLH